MDFCDEAVFDPGFYRSRHPELSGLSGWRLRRHWKRRGMVEGRTASPRFSAREYLESNPDLADAFGIEGFEEAIRHYLLQGRSEGRSGRCRDEVLRAGGKQVAVRCSRNWGHSIWSLRWGGKEFVNSHDAGRGLSAAWQEDGLLEGRNPTEAGNLGDAALPRCAGPSSSRPLEARFDGGTLATATQPAYWLPPGHPGSHADSVLSPSSLRKRVTFDFLQNPHLLCWEVEILFRGLKQQGCSQVQALSLFSYGEFARFWAFHASAPPGRRLHHLPIAPGELWDPCGLVVHSRRGDLRDARLDGSRRGELLRLLNPSRGGLILSNPSGSHAIGLYGTSQNALPPGWSMKGSQDTAWAARNLLGLDENDRGLPDDNGTSFLCSVCRFFPQEGARHRFRSWIAVGSMEDVTAGMGQLFRHGL